MASTIQVRVKPFTGAVVEFMDVDPAWTAAAFRAKIAETTGVPLEEFRLYKGKAYLADARKLSDAGVVNGTNLRMSTRTTPKGQAAARVAKLGGAARSTKHDIRAAKEDIVEVVVNQGNANAQAVAQLGADMREVVAEVGARVDVAGGNIARLANVLEGAPAERKPTQSDASRMQELRNRKRFCDAELTGLREREGLRIAQAKRSRSDAVATSAMVAAGHVQLATGDLRDLAEVTAKRQELAAQHKASRKVLSEREKQLRNEERAENK